MHALENVLILINKQCAILVRHSQSSSVLTREPGDPSGLEP